MSNLQVGNEAAHQQQQPQQTHRLFDNSIYTTGDTTEFHPADTSDSPGNDESFQQTGQFLNHSNYATGDITDILSNSLMNTSSLPTERQEQDEIQPLPNYGDKRDLLLKR